MMTNSGHALQISVSGRIVAHLEYQNAHSRLVWQDGYWDDPDRPVLGLRFENDPGGRVSGARRLPAWFSNLLPEGRLRELIAHDAGVTTHDEAELLGRIGHDLPGAVQVAPVTSWDSQWRPDLESAADIQENRGTQGEPLRFSLAGVALKYSLLRDTDRLTIPASNKRGDWIAKTPDRTFPHVPTSEFTTMKLAGLVGLNVPSVELFHRDDLPGPVNDAWPSPREEYAYAVARFDRTVAGAVHIEDLAQVRGFYPERKYEGTYQTLANLVARGRDEESLLEFVRRLAFSIAIGNADLHLKNVSLMYPDGRRATLSPAYDLVSTLPYLRSEIDLALRLGSTREARGVTPESLARLAERAHPGVRVGERTLEVVARLAASLREQWPNVAPYLDVLPEHREFVTSRIDWFAQRFG